MNSYRWLVLFWLASLAFVLALVVLVGGATRLTESGLSITQWQPVSGILPPLSASAWQSAFAEYQAIPQFSLLWPEMDLAEFKRIYWWEWAHRFMARLAGLLFLIPCVIFWRRGVFSSTQRGVLLAMLALGVLQAFAGWWMVQSGFEAGMVAVSHFRLAIHLSLALLLYGLVVLLWLTIYQPRRFVFALPPFLLLALLFGQMILGALAAGLDSGLVLNFWPAITSAGELFSRSFLFDPAAVQLLHRLCAYTILLFLLIYLPRLTPPQRVSGFLLVIAILAQTLLGIVMVLLVAPLPLALLHQTGGLLCWSLALFHLHQSMPITPRPTQHVDIKRRRA